jgi:hypothetical protein
MGENKNKGQLATFLKAENRVFAVEGTGGQTIKRIMQGLPWCPKTWIQTVCTAKEQ